jgi:hypothetical protein
MQKIGKLGSMGAICVVTSLLNGDIAKALAPRGPNPNCPEVKIESNWRDYFLSGMNQQFEIRFDAMQGKSDAGWGTLSKGLCLRGFFWKKSVWRVYGTQRNGTNNFGDYSNADVNKNQMSIWGHVFSFESETGEVYDAAQGLVGHLHCAQICG